MQNPDLQAGISDQNNSWELIVKYHGSLDGLSDAGIGVEYLIAGYAILTVPGGLVEEIAGLEQIEYVEKPKAFYTQQIDPGRDSCLQELPGRGLSLSGKGVVIAILDSGIDYRLQEFRQEDGGTRIRYLWDQTAVPGQGFAPPAGFLQGVELTQAQINAALLGGGNETAPGVLPTMDIRAWDCGRRHRGRTKRTLQGRGTGGGPSHRQAGDGSESVLSRHERYHAGRDMGTATGRGAWRAAYYQPKLWQYLWSP